MMEKTIYVYDNLANAERQEQDNCRFDITKYDTVLDHATKKIEAFRQENVK